MNSFCVDAAPRVLCVPELLRMVFELSTDQANVVHASVCKTWNEEATRIIWRDVSTDRLFSLLAPLVSPPDREGDEDVRPSDFLSPVAPLPESDLTNGHSPALLVRLKMKTGIALIGTLTKSARSVSVERTIRPFSRKLLWGDVAWTSFPILSQCIIPNQPSFLHIRASNA